MRTSSASLSAAVTPILSLGTGSCAPRPLSLSLEEQFRLHKAITSRVLLQPPINETGAVLSRVTLGQGDGWPFVPGRHVRRAAPRSARAGNWVFLQDKLLTPVPVQTDSHDLTFSFSLVTGLKAGVKNTVMFSMFRS